MYKKTLALAFSLLLLLSGCGTGDISASTDTGVTESVSGNSGTTTSEEDPSTHATVNTVNLVSGKYSDEKLDPSYSSSDPVITLKETTAETTASKGVSIQGNQITITVPGTYILEGQLTDGQVLVDVTKNEIVKLVLDNVKMDSSETVPIYIKEGDVIITLADTSDNTISYTKEEDGSSEPDAAIYSKGDLSFNGEGSLTVNSSSYNGIKCKDDLKFISGTFHITSGNNGMVGKDSVSIKDGDFTIIASADGIKSTNTEESDKGYIMIDGGTLTIDAGLDGIQAETLLRINSGEFHITTGGGNSEFVEADMTVTQMNPPMDGMERPSGGMEKPSGEGEIPFGDTEKPFGDMEKPSGDMERPSGGGGKGMGKNNPPQDLNENTTSTEVSTDSTKGLKSYMDIIIAGGTFTIHSKDDSIHSNHSITIDGGILSLYTDDDGIHADQLLTINNGEITVHQSYEGLEAYEITINNGTVQLKCSDDGINAAGESGQDETNDSAQNPETGKGFGGQGMHGSQGAILTINGGKIVVSASGDGLDANGTIYLNGGTVIVHGPTSGGDGSLDYDGEFLITEGTLFTVGSAGMVQTPSGSSSQTFLSGTFDQVVKAGSTIVVNNDAGEEIASLVTEKDCQWYCFSSPLLEEDKTFHVSVKD